MAPDGSNAWRLPARAGRGIQGLPGRLVIRAQGLGYLPLLAVDRARLPAWPGSHGLDAAIAAGHGQGRSDRLRGLPARQRRWHLPVQSRRQGTEALSANPTAMLSRRRWALPFSTSSPFRASAGRSIEAVRAALRTSVNHPPLDQAQGRQCKQPALGRRCIALGTARPEAAALWQRIFAQLWS